MPWDPAVLRKYGTTSHFRLLNQVRSELKSSPLSRNKDGELSVSMGRRGPNYRVAVEVRNTSSGSSGSDSKPRRGAPHDSQSFSLPNSTESLGSDSSSFRDRLRAIDMR